MLKIFTKVSFLFFFLLSTGSLVLAQQRLTLEIKVEDQNPSFVRQKLKFQSTLADSAAVRKELQAVIRQLQRAAYLEASVIKRSQRDSTVVAILRTGALYEWANLKNGNVEESFLSKVGYRERLYRNKPFYYTDLVELQESLLSYAENNGYPFAAVWLDSIQILDGKVEAQLMMQRNRLSIFDDLNIIGDAKISTTYLQSYLGIIPGEPFSKEKVLKVRNRIKELPFLKERQNATVTFLGEKARVNLFLEPKKASRFDFILGFLPTSNASIGADPELRRFQVTATFEADMTNQFGLGESIYMQFEQLRPETQELQLRFAYPYILNLPFGVDAQFELYKRDTAYLDVISDLGIQYLLEGGNYIKAFWNQSATNLLNINARSILQSRRLPATLDVRNSTFGLEYQLQRLDYRFNPRRGWAAWFRGGAGFKEIRKNDDILGLKDPDQLDFSFEELYDTLNLNTLQYRLSARMEAYLPVFANSVVKSSVRAGGIFSEQDIYFNEQFRLGGNRILRGYDEETIFATRYAVFTLEYRLLLGQNSYLYTFGDYGIVDNKTVAIDRIDYPLGFGAGITFETGVGIFGFSLALGRLSDGSFDVRNTKSHFGYVSLF